jgi:hypothetical protein
MVEGSVWLSKAAGTERERLEEEEEPCFSRALPSDLTPSTKPHLLKDPPPPNSTQGPTFGTWAFGGVPDPNCHRDANI